MDRITQGLVDEFVKNFDLGKEPPEEQFEHFVNVAVVSSEYHESFDPADVHVGKDANPGIDGLAIIVNGSLVTEEEEVEDLLGTNKYLEVTFIFTQAKTSSSFDGADMGSFIEAVRDFFREKPRLVRGQDLKAKAAIADRVFKNTAKMRSNTVCLMFYVTTGTWQDDQNLLARLAQGKQELEATSLFSEVRSTPCGAKEIQRLYRASKEAVAVEIDFPSKVTLPEIENVSQAFVGVVPVATLFQLITDDSGNIRRSVFEDNIRDFQGDTSVNAAIAETLSSPGSSRFVVLNNGITVVCRELAQTGNKCTLHGYQVVNGCQTSHILLENRDKFDPNRVLVTLKLVGSANEELVNAIIRATNSQNAVKPEELEAMTEFQKQLELYYGTFSGSQALYYERRSKQWAASPAEKTRVVTIPTQIKAFASMFLSAPHRVAGYYGTVRRKLGDTIFRNDHRQLPYYTSAYALYRLECLFRSRTLDAKYKPLKWFLLLLFRQAVGGAMPVLNSKMMDNYCEGLLAVLRDNPCAAGAFDTITSKLHGVFPPLSSDHLKTQSYRDILLATICDGELAGA